MGSNPVAVILDLFWVLFHGILINPQNFAYWFSNQEIALSGEFLVPYSPKYGPILLNSHQRRYFSKQRHWKFMKDSSFYGKGTNPKGPFLGPTLNPRFLLKMTKLKWCSSRSSSSSSSSSSSGSGSGSDSGSGSGSGSDSGSGSGSGSCSGSASVSASASASGSASGSGSSSRI